MSSSPHNAPSQRGLTFIELLVVMAIISMAMMAAMPRLQAWTADYRVGIASRTLVNMLKSGRGNAIQTGGRWHLTFDKAQLTAAYNDNESCSYDPGSGDGKRAFMVFRDADNDGAYDANESVAGCYLLPPRTERKSFAYCGGSSSPTNYGFIRDGGPKIHTNGVRGSFWAVFISQDFDDIRTAVIGTTTGQVCSKKLLPTDSLPSCGGSVLTCPFDPSASP